MKKFALLFIIALFGTTMYAQCGQIVDNAGVLNTSDLATSISQLSSVGAEPHFVSIINLGSFATVDALEASMVKGCPSWEGANGGRKNNLVVFIVAVKAHKMGIFYGSAFHRALDSSYLNIQQEDMKPKFRDGDFTGGFAAGASAITENIKAARVVSHGSTTVVTEQATDYSGLWTVMKWIVFFIIIGSIFGGVWFFFRAKKQVEDQRDEAQRIARSKKSDAVNSVSALDRAAVTDVEKAKVTHLQDMLDELTSSSKYDVESSLTAATYTYIGQRYEKISDLAAGYTDKADRTYNRTAKTNSSAQAAAEDYVAKGSPYIPPPTAVRPYVPPTNTVVEHYHTTYVDNTPTYIEPVFIPEPIYEEPIRHYEAPAPEPESSCSSSDDSDNSSSGGSSDWSSSDSSSDFGGSSDFSSGDSGGGGGSDW